MFKALESQWKVTPPVSQSLRYLAQYHGMKLDSPPRPKKKMAMQDAIQFMQKMFPGGVVK